MQIHEDFLYYLWQYKLFDVDNLKDHQGQKITILQSGKRNTFGGPDFFNAKIKIGDQVWAGNVEIHVSASDWYRHLHQGDPFYDNVILHVVWEKDAEIFDKHKVMIPCVELSRHTNASLLHNYRDLIYRKPVFISCETHIKEVDELVFDHWKERLFMDRLESKSEYIENLWKNNKGDWEQTLYMLMAKNFGLHTNGEAFFHLAKSISWAVIKKERNDLSSLEALYFGQTGLLKNPEPDSYQNELAEKYQFLRHKYQLIGPPVLVQFGRLRPFNFPTLRLAQFAALLYTRKSLFSKLVNLKSLQDFYEFFQVSAAGFWSNHYTFQKEAVFMDKKISKSFVDLLLINTLIPLRFLYFKQIGQENNEHLFEIMEQIKSEKNYLIRSFKEMGIPCSNAIHSQALMQLKQVFCEQKRCLDCEVGNFLIKGKQQWV